MTLEHIPLGGNRSPGATWDNHRATVRYRCAPATPGKVEVVEDQEFQRGWVQDLSLSGVGLVLPRPIPASTPIVVQVRTPSLTTKYQLHARVIHSTRRPGGDFLIGCELVDALNDDQLDHLLYDF